MNWDAIGAIGELVGALAVVLTLLYLSAQIRQSNRATHSASIQEATTAFNGINAWIANDESMARIFRIGIQDLDKLNDDEKIRFSFLMLSTFHVFETIFLQNRAGTIDASMWEAEIRSLVILATAPGGRQWWVTNPYSFTTEFREFVANEIEKAT